MTNSEFKSAMSKQIVRAVLVTLRNYKGFNEWWVSINVDGSNAEIVCNLEQAVGESFMPSDKAGGIT